MLSQPHIDDTIGGNILNRSEQMVEHSFNQEESKASFKAPSEKSKTSE